MKLFNTTFQSIWLSSGMEEFKALYLFFAFILYKPTNIEILPLTFSCVCVILPQVLITDVEIQQRETIKQIIEKGWRHRKELLFPVSLVAGYVIDI